MAEKQGAQYTLLLESVAEISARLRVLDEAYARLEAAVERQLELLEFVISRQGQLIRQQVTGEASHPKTQDDMLHMASEADSGQVSTPQSERIVDRDAEYT